jgi:hypothetical protein
MIIGEASGMDGVRLQKHVVATPMDKMNKASF